MLCIHSNHSRVSEFDNVSIYKCKGCGIIFSDKYWVKFNPKELYQKFYKNEIGARFNFGAEYVVKLFRFFRAFKIFTLAPKAKSILDIGSGRGFTLYYLKKYYKYQRAIGTQISKNALDFSRNKLGLSMHDEDLLDINFKNESFDIITLWHVLEHVRDSEAYVEKIHNLLNKQGKLIIEVPNYNSWTRAFTGKYWLGLDLNHHVNFFNSVSLTQVLKKCNFRVQSIRTFSLEYSIFISVQSIVSALTNSDHLFFNFLQGNMKRPVVMLHILLFIVLTPVCLAVNLLLYFSKKGEVLLIVAENIK